MTPLTPPALWASNNACTMAPFWLSCEAVVFRCSSLPLASLVISSKPASFAFAAVSAFLAFSTFSSSIASCASSSAICFVNDFTFTSAEALPSMAAFKFFSTSACFSSTNFRSALATSNSPLASAILPSHGCSSFSTPSIFSPISAISPFNPSNISSSLLSSPWTFASRSAFLVSNAGTSFSIFSHSTTIFSFCAISLANFSSSFFTCCFMCFKSSRNFTSFFSNSANSFVELSRFCWISFISVAWALNFASIPFSDSLCSLCLDFSSSRLVCKPTRFSDISAITFRVSMTSNCKEIDFACNKSFSFCKNNSASFFTISNASFSFSTSVNRETIPPLFSFNSSSFLPASSIGSTYWFVPMISSIYSNNPSSLSASSLKFARLRLAKSKTGCCSSPPLYLSTSLSPR